MNAKGRPLLILVVDDDDLLAMKLITEIIELGSTVVGPFASVEDAILCTEPIDAAILCVRLGEGNSFPIAEVLRNAGIPFVFLKGRKSPFVPPRFCNVRTYCRPGRAPHLLAQLRAERADGAAQGPDTYESIVTAMLARAQDVMPDAESAERLVAAVLRTAIDSIDETVPGNEPRRWLFALLERELKLRRRSHLN